MLNKDNRDKIKGQFGKNTNLTSTKTLPKKQDHFPINFQIVFSTYKETTLTTQHHERRKKQL